MSAEDLEEHGLLLPEEHHGRLPLESAVSEGTYLMLGLLALAGCAMMALGGGEELTWWGAGVFIGTLLALAFTLSSGIDQRADLVRRRLDSSRVGREHARRSS